MTIHPKVAQQPVCADRLTLSRERIQRLIDRADGVVLRPSTPDMRVGYASGVAEVLEYLLDGDATTSRLNQTLGIGR